MSAAFRQAGPDCVTEPFAACLRVPNVHGLILKTSVYVRQNQPGGLNDCLDWLDWLDWIVGLGLIGLDWIV